MGTANVWIFQAVFSVLVLLVAQRQLATMTSVPKGVRIRHYLFLAFFTFGGLAGFAHAGWTIGRLVSGNLVDALLEHFIALRGLSPFFAVAVWIYCVVGLCIAMSIVLGIGRSRSQSRRRFLKYYPLLVLAYAMSFCIDFRGARALGDGLTEMTQNLIAFSVWAVCLGWLYAWVYWFYRTSTSDPLFDDSSSQGMATDDG